jgi:hypothetical protein
MITRKSLGTLAAVTLVLFAFATIVGDDRDGPLRIIAKVSWFSFLACFLFLMVGSVATLVRYRVGSGRS